MKKLGALLLVVVLGISAVTVSTVSAVNVANTDVWGTFFPDNEIFNGDVFVNDTAENNGNEEQGEVKKDWEIIDGRIFAPSWANETPSRIFSPGWANITKHSDKPAGYFKVNWGIKI